ncbi:hypothetical protein Tco_0797014 [Tanacetum coccineum]
MTRTFIPSVFTFLPKGLIYEEGIVLSSPEGINPCLPSLLENAAHSERTASVQVLHSFQGLQHLRDCSNTKDYAFQRYGEPMMLLLFLKSPNDYTTTDASQTSEGDEGLL